MLTGPPVAANEPKWLGFGMFRPSNCHNVPDGEFPRTTISFRESSPDTTPAKLAAILDGSPNAPAYRFVSSTLNDRPLASDSSLLVLDLSLLRSVVITTSFRFSTASVMVTFKTTSLPAVTTMFDKRCGS
ncbi:hypothetical protein D3C86_1894170 [compost metagenome]